MQAGDSGVSCQEVHQREPIVYWAPPQAPTPCHTQLGWDFLNVSTNDFKRFDFLFISKAHKSMVKNLT